MAPQAQDRRRPSVTYTVLVLAGIVLAIAGAAVAVLGLGSPTATSVEGSGISVKTTSVGLIIMVVGAALAGIAAVKKPSDVELFSDRGSPRAPGDAIVSRTPAPAFVVLAVGIVLAVVSIATQ